MHGYVLDTASCMEDLVGIEQIVHTIQPMPVIYYIACTCANVGICLDYTTRLAGSSWMDYLHCWVWSFEYQREVSPALMQCVSHNAS